MPEKEKLLTAHQRAARQQITLAQSKRASLPDRSIALPAISAAGNGERKIMENNGLQSLPVFGVCASFWGCAPAKLTTTMHGTELPGIARPFSSVFMGFINSISQF